MTKEENYIILRDLCGRIPYGVKVNAENVDHNCTGEKIQLLKGIEVHLGNVAIPGADIYTENDKLLYWEGHCDMPKPYLRSMDKMTEKEIKELDEVDWSNTDENYQDWLNRYYFDYNCLIRDNLAIEAPDGMYEIKENMYDIKYNWNERQ